MNPLAYVRTYAPIVAGAILTWLISLIPAVGDALTQLARLGISRTAIFAAGAGLIMALYYALARYLGKRWPNVEKWMLGSAATPTYVRLQKGRSYGWTPDVPDARDHKATLTVTKLPPEVDMRPGMPPVYDQGQLGSCTANAIAAAFDFDRHIQGLAFINPSRLFVYYNERVIEGTVSSDSGAQIRDGIKTLKSNGVPPEKLWPYIVSKFTTRPSKKAVAAAIANVALEYRKVDQSQAAIQAVLASGLPVVIGFTVYESFESDTVANTGIVPMPSPGEQVLGGHAVLVVGYKKIGSTLYFLARNSWGADWGIGGYFYLPAKYLTTKSLASDFWKISSVTQAAQ